MDFKTLLILVVGAFAIALSNSGFAQQSKEDRQAYFNESKRENAVIQLALDGDLAAYKEAVLRAPDAVNFQWTKTYKMDENDDETTLHFAAKNGDMPIHTAASAGRAGAVEFLIEKGADVNARASGSIALSWAAGHYLDVVKVLLAPGATFDAKQGARGI